MSSATIRRLLSTSLLVWCACVTPTRQKQAQARADLGAAYLREGNAAAALEVLQDAVRKDPRNWLAWDHLGLALWAQGDIEGSEKAFQRGLRLAPDKAEINNNYGLMLMEQGRYDEAVERFQQARKDLEYRKPALLLTNLGNAYYHLGRYDDALEVLDEAIRRTPALCNAHFERAMVYEALGRLDAALASYEKSVELCGDVAPGASYQAARLLLEKGDRQAACAYLAGILDSVDPGSDLYASASELQASGCR